jgi:flagellar motor protein MotB
MRTLRFALILGTILGLIACAGQPKAPPQEDPRIGELQGQVDDLQKQNASKDATISRLQAQLADPQKEGAGKDRMIAQLQAGNTEVANLQKSGAAKDETIAQLNGQLADLNAAYSAAAAQVAAKNERMGKIQAELDRLKSDYGETVAGQKALDAKILAVEMSDDALMADIDALQAGSKNVEASYLAQIAALTRDKAALQSRIDELTKENEALGIASMKDQQELDARIAQLKSIFSQEIARGDLEIRKFRDILIVSVKDSVLFPPDSPVLRTEMGDILKELAGVFKEAPDRIVRIEGNTAVAVSSPASLRLYPTSWHLAAARAANVAQFLQEKCGMDPLQLVATSLGEFRPGADNSTAEGKAQNRRVDFVLIARDVYEIDQLQTVVQ